MTLQLLHYSREPLTQVRDRTADLKPFESKPYGLWVSVGSAWKDWCEGEDWNLGAFIHTAKITLKPTARILTLSSTEDILNFTKEQHAPSVLGTWGLSWPKLAPKFDGIIISPYNWKCRYDLHTRWYYSWDCASGCIWRASAIDQIIPIEG